MKTNRKEIGVLSPWQNAGVARYGGEAGVMGDANLRPSPGRARVSGDAAQECSGESHVALVRLLNSMRISVPQM